MRLSGGRRLDRSPRAVPCVLVASSRRLSAAMIPVRCAPALPAIARSPASRVRTAPGRRALRRLRPGWVRVQPAAQVIGDEIDDDASGPAIQVAEDALAVAQAAQHRLVLIGGV